MIKHAFQSSLLICSLWIISSSTHAETWECEVVEDRQQRFENDYSNAASHTFTRISASEYAHVFQDWVLDEDYNLVPDSTKKTRNLEVVKDEVALSVALIGQDRHAYEFIKLTFLGRGGPQVTISSHVSDFPIGLGGVCKLICSSEDVMRWYGAVDACSNNPFRKQ